VRSDLEFQRTYEFLSRLRKEFEPRRAQLLARGRVPISEVISELRAEETRLSGVGLLAVTSVLAAHGPSSPASSTPSQSPAPPLLPTPQGQSQSRGQGQRQSRRGSRPRSHCTYCDMDGHTESSCYTKERDLRQQKASASPGTHAPSGASGSSTVTLTEQDILRIKRMLAGSGSPSTGTVGSVTDSSGTAAPPSSTQSGTSSWVLDSGASFHMTFDSSTLPSLRPLDSPISVLTADGTPLPVSSRGTLSTSSFSVPDISHVPRLTMNLFSARQLTDSGCRVILDVDSCSVQDRRTQALVGAGPRHRDSQGFGS